MPVTNYAKRMLLRGEVEFHSANELKVALYQSSANLTAALENYTTTGEAQGTGYTAGGKTVPGVAVVGGTGEATAYITTDAIRWTGATITNFRYAVLYKSSTRKVLGWVGLGGNQAVTNGTVELTTGDDAATALFSLG